MDNIQASRIDDECANGTELSAEVARLKAELAAIDAALGVEFQAGDKRSGDLLDDFACFFEHHKKCEAQNAALVAALTETYQKLDSLADSAYGDRGPTERVMNILSRAKTALAAAGAKDV